MSRRSRPRLEAGGDLREDELVMESGEQAEKHAGPTPRKRPVVGGVFAVIKGIIVAIAAVVVTSVAVKTFLVGSFYIPSQSMEQTLHIGDRVVVSKLTPGPFELHRGDVVVFSDPGGWLNESAMPQRGTNAVLVADPFSSVVQRGQDSAGNLVKRVIGLPGDHVGCCDAEGMLIVNGTAVDEKAYLAPEVKPSETAFDVTVPAGRLWVMGDNRIRSADSRYHPEAPYGGFVPIEMVIGRVYAVVWPFSHLAWLSTPPAFSSVGR